MITVIALSVGLGAVVAVAAAFWFCREMFLDVNDCENRILDDAWEEARLPGPRPK